MSYLDSVVKCSKLEALQIALSKGGLVSHVCSFISGEGECPYIIYIYIYIYLPWTFITWEILRISKG